VQAWYDSLILVAILGPVGVSVIFIGMQLAEPTSGSFGVWLCRHMDDIESIERVRIQGPGPQSVEGNTDTNHTYDYLPHL